MQGWACKKYRNKEGMRTQGDYPVAEKSWRKRLEDYSTSVAQLRNRS